ncbi:hypothetical protein FMM74_020490 [Lachnospiraceae bacterium MD308]|nr:hypothetical protein [Lachnospiraceae bacterium MD308]
MPDDDIIKMNTDIVINDVNGQPIPVEVQSPEYLTETFSWDGIERNHAIKKDE